MKKLLCLVGAAILLVSCTESKKADPASRVNVYEAYPNPAETAKELKTSTYSQYENPTGIYFEANDSIVVHAENITGDVFLKINAFGEKWEESKYPLKNGENVFIAKNNGNSYVEYYSDNYANAANVKLEIKTGKVNGFFDASKHSNEDWKFLLANAQSVILDIVGERIQLAYPVEQLNEFCPEDGIRLIGLYDSIITIQHQIMGLDKYDRVPKNRMLGRVIWNGFMHADAIGAAFHVSTMEGLMVPEKIRENSWGIAHEFGHVNQVRPNMTWVGTTEVTNNIYSVWTQYVFNPDSPKFEREHHTSYDEPVILGRFNSYMESAIIKKQAWLTQAGPDEWKRWHDEANPPYWHGDHFVKLIPLWQLQLYFSVIGEGNPWHQPDFYADLFQEAINDEGTYTHGEHQLNFMRRMCDVTKTDLTDFFENARMLIAIDEYIGDYTSAQLTITEEQVKELKEHASQYAKPTVALNYVSANSIDATKQQKDITGELNKGVRVEHKTIVVDHVAWQNVLAFETYAKDEVIKIAIAGTGSEANTETIVRFPENASRVDAVGWDGKRTTVYQK